jgi:hypothetical protein
VRSVAAERAAVPREPAPVAAETNELVGAGSV